jgi:hypothetical protein
MSELDNVINGIFRMFGDSKPGDSIHNLIVVAADRSGKFHTSVYAIVHTPDTTLGWLLSSTFNMAANSTAKDGHTTVFAMLSLEINTTKFPQGIDEASVAERERQLQMRAQHRLDEHEHSREVTMMYSAAADGRRWTGWYEITGPNAGSKTGPTELTGPVTKQEIGLQHRLVRRLVGNTEWPTS